MNYAVLFIGGLMTLAGLIILVRPAVFFDPLKKYQDSTGLWLLAVVVRLGVGLLLVTAAPASRFPLALEILGWLAIGAAVLIAALGRARFSRLLNWLLQMADTLGRVSGLLALGFGLFLIYAVAP